MPIPPSHEDILRKRSFAQVATADKDGIPQVTPVWVDSADGYILINTAKGRKKDRNLRQNPNVAISIQDPEDPYRYVGIQGRIAESTEEGAVEHIHALSQKYWGRDFDIPDGQIRVIYKIEPVRSWTMG